MIAFLLSPIARYIGFALLAFAFVGGIYYYGYSNGKEAIRAELNEKLNKALQANIALDGERVKIEQELSDERNKKKEVVRVVKQKIPEYITDNRSCDLPIELVKLLRSARSGELPKPTE